MNTIEIIITVIGVLGSLFGIFEGVKFFYNKYRKKPLNQLMNELADKNTSIKRQKALLHKIQSVSLLSDIIISNEYINSFNSEGRGKINIFRDLCRKNNIEPTREFCI